MTSTITFIHRESAITCFTLFIYLGRRHTNNEKVLNKVSLLKDILKTYKYAEYDHTRSVLTDKHLTHEPIVTVMYLKILFV